MIELDLQKPILPIEIEIEEVMEGQGGGGEYDEYKGEYKVIPKTEKQTLETKNKVMKNNVTVAEIPFFEVSNETGTTVIIGGIA